MNEKLTIQYAKVKDPYAKARDPKDNYNIFTLICLG